MVMVRLIAPPQAFIGMGSMASLSLSAGFIFTAGFPGFHGEYVSADVPAGRSHWPRVGDCFLFAEHHLPILFCVVVSMDFHCCPSYFMDVQPLVGVAGLSLGLLYGLRVTSQ